MVRTETNRAPSDSRWEPWLWEFLHRKSEETVMSTTRQPHDDFLVVGGGIGGLAAAVALAREGRSVAVLERAAQFGEVGAGLQLAPNATRVLRGWGLLDEVVEMGVRPRRLVMSDALTGLELTSMDLGREFLARYGAPYIVMHRSDLLDILLRACRSLGVALHNGKQVLGAESDDEGVTITCADGTSYRGQAAIAADGLRSSLRRLLVDDEPVAAGYVAYRGARPIAELRTHGDLRDVQLFVGPGMHLVGYPVRGGQMYNQVAVFRSARFFAGESEWGTQQELTETFGRACPEVRDAVEALWTDQAWPMYDREPIERWVSGHVALLGDAAHPMLQYLAQGACQALEDAAALAAAVRDHAQPAPTGGGGNGINGGIDSGIDKALAEYERVRIPRTTRVQRSARIWGEIWHTDGVALLLRNELFARRSATEFRESDWLYADGTLPPA